MALVLLIGTLNRVMIVELGVPAWLVGGDGLAAAGVRAVPRPGRLPLRHAQLGARLEARAVYLDGHAAAVRRAGDHAVRADRAVRRHQRADHHRPGRRRRSPSCWSAPDCTPRRPSAWRWPPTSHRPSSNPRVVALLCIMMLVGMVVSALLFGVAAGEFQRNPADPGDPGHRPRHHGAQHRRAVETGGARSRRAPRSDRPQPSFAEAWQAFAARPRHPARLVALGLGTVAFSMQDILLEPYGGQVLHLTVGTTTALDRRCWRSAASCGFGLGGATARARRRSLSAGRLRRAGRPGRLQRRDLRRPARLRRRCSRIGVALIGFGGGLFAHCTLTAAMGMAAPRARSAWRSASGARCRRPPPAARSALGGLIRDGVSALAAARRARRGAGRARRPATASSTTSRSRCCSRPWSRSARWCAPRRGRVHRSSGLTPFRLRSALSR